MNRPILLLFLATLPAGAQYVYKIKTDIAIGSEVFESAGISTDLAYGNVVVE